MVRDYFNYFDKSYAAAENLLEGMRLPTARPTTTKSPSTAASTSVSTVLSTTSISTTTTHISTTAKRPFKRTKKVQLRNTGFFVTISPGIQTPTLKTKGIHSPK